MLIDKAITEVIDDGATGYQRIEISKHKALGEPIETETYFQEGEVRALLWRIFWIAGQADSREILAEMAQHLQKVDNLIDILDECKKGNGK